MNVLLPCIALHTVEYTVLAGVELIEEGADGTADAERGDCVHEGACGVGTNCL